MNHYFIRDILVLFAYMAGVWWGIMMERYSEQWKIVPLEEIELVSGAICTLKIYEDSGIMSINQLGILNQIKEEFPIENGEYCWEY